MEKIVIIDDEEDIADILELLLEDEYKIYKSYRALPGEKIIKEQKPAIVFLDIDLPDKSGLDVLKDLEAPDSVNVILMSGKVDMGEETAKSLGTRTFIQKPFTQNRIKEVIKEILNK
ncbi:response regulator [bacterium]